MVCTFDESTKKHRINPANFLERIGIDNFSVDYKNGTVRLPEPEFKRLVFHIKENISDTTIRFEAFGWYWEKITNLEKREISITKPTFYQEQTKVNIENWPSLLFNESMATVSVKLTDTERDALIRANPVNIESTGESISSNVQETINALSVKLTKYINQFPNGVFIKLGSRSPKDSFLGYREGFRCFDGEKAVNLLLDSERVIDDLYKDKHHNYPSHIIIREWITIPEWAEFRGFIKNRRLVGLSQYNYLNKEVFPELIEYADSIEWAVKQKVEKIADLLPVPDVVADFFYKVRTYENERVNEVKLIELNPFSIWTDPCLFNWSHDKFQIFEFRFFNYPALRGV